MLFFTTTCLLLLATASDSFQQQSFEAPSAVDAKSPEKPVPILNFTTNTTKVENGKPFLASCHISNFTDHASRNYSIRFYRSSRLDTRQWIANYKLTIKPSGVQSVIFEGDTPFYYFTTTPGPHFAYPTFDLVIKAHEPENNNDFNLLKNYWCELVVHPQDNTAGANELLVVSNVWVNTPLLRLAISGPLVSDPSNSTFTASCHVHHLEKRIRKGPEYQVKLLLANHANLIPDRYNELAVFHVPTHLGPMMFLRNDSYLGRSAVSEGDNDALPLFDFVYRTWGSSKQDYFACRLEDPLSDWKQVTSDRVLHL